MGDLWLKIKVWTKGIVAVLVVLYVLLFVYNNSDKATVWWWFNHKFESSTLVLIGVAFLAGVISTVLFRTTLRTIRQVQDLRSRSRADRLEREMADMKSKAEMLQTKPAPSSGARDASPSLDQEPLE